MKIRVKPSLLEELRHPLLIIFDETDLNVTLVHSQTSIPNLIRTIR